MFACVFNAQCGCSAIARVFANTSVQQMHISMDLPRSSNSFFAILSFSIFTSYYSIKTSKLTGSYSSFCHSRKFAIMSAM